MYVSRSARLTASITPPAMPGSAAGTITRRIVSDVVAPMASEPSRIACGTALIESSAMEETNGMIITPITMPAASADSDEALLMPMLTANSRTAGATVRARSEEHKSELQSVMRITYAVVCLMKQNPHRPTHNTI